MVALYTLLLGSLVVLLLTISSDADLGVKGNNAVDPILGSKKAVASVNRTDLSAGGSSLHNSDAEPNRVDKVKNKDNADKGNLVGDLGSSGQVKGKGKDGKKDEEKMRTGLGSIRDPKEVQKEGDAGSRNEGPQIEECDTSHRCTAEKGKLVACLRMPGSDSPKLSLLIQNKGKGPLAVLISAPDFVELKETKVQVKENENHEVMVSVQKLGSQSVIYLTAGTDNCTLDFREMIPHIAEKDSDGLTTSQPTNYLRQQWLTAFIVFAALCVLAAVGVFIGVKKKLLRSNESKYQRIDMMELPVTHGRKPESSDASEGWDDSWGDGWDDEEVPKTPSMPVTPRLSSKGYPPKGLPLAVLLRKGGKISLPLPFMEVPLFISSRTLRPTQRKFLISMGTPGNDHRHQDPLSSASFLGNGSI